MSDMTHLDVVDAINAATQVEPIMFCIWGDALEALEEHFRAEDLIAGRVFGDERVLRGL